MATSYQHIGCQMYVNNSNIVSYKLNICLTFSQFVYNNGIKRKFNKTEPSELVDSSFFMGRLTLTFSFLA